LTPEDRRRLRKEAVHAVRLLAESLEHAEDDAQNVAEGQALVARLQAAIEPLRSSTAALSGEGTLSAAPLPGADGAALSGSGTLSVAVHHVVTVYDRVAVLDNATVTLTAHDLTGTSAAPATGTGTATVSVTGTGSGEAPQTFQVTADDTPWIMWQILLRLDDLSNPTKPPVTVGQVYDRLMPLLSVIITLLLS
jgi:hypothetical protein